MNIDIPRRSCRATGGRFSSNMASDNTTPKALPIRYSLLAALAAAMLVACGSPASPTTSLIVSFQVEPRAAQAGDSLTAILTIANPTADTVTLYSGSGCVNTLLVLRDGEPVRMEGAAFFCLDVISQFAVPPGQQLVRGYDLVALLQEDHPPFGYVVSPPAGAYAVRALMQVQLDDMDAGFWISH